MKFSAENIRDDLVLIRATQPRADYWCPFFTWNSSSLDKAAFNASGAKFDYVYDRVHLEFLSEWAEVDLPSRRLRLP